MTKTAICLTFIFCFFYVSVNQGWAQTQENDSHITIDATGEVSVPADMIQFRVTITQFKQDAREAFELHKQQEEFLTDLLIKEEIPDSNIIANPISISNVRRRNDMENGYETRQQVIIVLHDVSQFEAMQITLIENGFINFSGSFSSTKIEEASDEALKKAVDEAKMKAEILAEAAGKEVADVVSINYSTARTYSARSSGMEMAYDASSGSLLQFERRIPVRENVNVRFRIE